METRFALQDVFLSDNRFRSCPTTTPLQGETPRPDFTIMDIQTNKP